MQARPGLVLAMTYSYRDCIINFYGIWLWKYTVCSKDTFLTQGKPGQRMEQTTHQKNLSMLMLGIEPLAAKLDPMHTRC